ncbi:alpha/beta hydrolase [Halorussus marinus]|uniref:alpha/beta hydrolase n=1 Tax=Halorussus marinus TaxID=2505976 RepID=UPI001FCE362D|nr:alpha/beta hydrolase [Halorussus marinus]
MRRLKLAVVVVLAVVLVGAVGAVAYLSTPFHATPASIQSVEDDPRVSVSTDGDVAVLAPADRNASVGVVFYPGARVAPDAYFETLAPLVARTGAVVFVPKMPLNVALLDADAAGEIRARNPDVRTWVVGGHSLGGVAACRYAASHDVRGLVLFASYCDGDVSDRGLAVLSVTGSADAVLDRDAYRAARSRLPPDATVREVPGINHTQFGAYRGQRGDASAPLSYEAAHRRLAEVVVPWFANATTETPRPDTSAAGA